ncbi:GMC oxidoreductase [Streptomyces sp. NPDC060053]|uniref:GMC oxidoreductase n=1 Tax=Streptomyces sp. NPDC060053 TaxID=3347047 RepID=UPI0036807A24
MESVDLLIVGSGPVGAAFARRVLDASPTARVLMVELGEQLTDQPGANLRNLPLPERRRLQQPAEPAADASAQPAHGRRTPVTPPRGTSLVRPDLGLGSDQDDMPMAAYTDNVGGMGAHWTCAVPRPAGSERVPFIPAAELDSALAAAERLLGAEARAFAETETSRFVRDRLERVLGERLKRGRGVRPMPLACRPRDGQLPSWSGVDTLLDPLEPARFVLRTRTLCRRLLTDGGTVSGAVLDDLRSGVTFQVEAKAVVIAAGPFRTPQLLWASGIRPPAVGRHLNDHPMITAAVRLYDRRPAGRHTARPGLVGGDEIDYLTGAYWVPFNDVGHPYHGQVMLMQRPERLQDRAGGEVSCEAARLAWYVPKDTDARDRLVFHATETDRLGMPAFTISHRLSDRDRDSITGAVTTLTETAEALGEYLPGEQPRLLASGASMHYQGSVRMGERDDGTSVCDPMARVWGFENLFLGGTGVIPTATACNPTLTGVALAVRSAAAVVSMLNTPAAALSESGK